MTRSKVWEKTLSDGEKIEYEFSIGDRYRMFCLIVWGIISIPLLFLYGFGVLVFLLALFYCAFYLKIASAYAFTNKRILVHTGWLSTKTISVDYKQITDITVVEPFLDKFFTKTGNLAINTAGSNGSEVVLPHITAPYEVKKKLSKIRDQK